MMSYRILPVIFVHKRRFSGSARGRVTGTRTCCPPFRFPIEVFPSLFAEPLPDTNDSRALSSDGAFIIFGFVITHRLRHSNRFLSFSSDRASHVICVCASIAKYLFDAVRMLHTARRRCSVISL